MTRSSMTKTALLVGGALLWVMGLGPARAQSSRESDKVMANHKGIAKTHLKGELLSGFNKALTQSSAADLHQADRIRVDAEAAARCNAFLEKTVPYLQKSSLELGREYRRLRSENQALHAEYARLKNLHKSAPKYQLEATYHQKVARHLVAYRIYLAKIQARKAMLLGMTFCVRIIQKHDPALGARWAAEMSKLLAAR
jgi:hypothetical protein